MHAAHHVHCTSRTHITHTAHRSARHHIDTRSAHSHAHAPQPVRRQGGALAKFLRPRLPRTATRRSAPVCPALAFLCFSAPSPLPETQARGTSTRALASSTPARLPQALASSTHPQSPACTHFLTKGCRVKKHGHGRLVHRRLSARFGCRLQTITEHSGSSKEHSGSRTDVVLGRLLWPPDCTQTGWLSTSLNHPVYRHTRDVKRHTFLRPGTPFISNEPRGFQLAGVVVW